MHPEVIQPSLQWPRFSDVQRSENLDCEVSASGFTLALQKDLEKHVAAAKKDEGDLDGAAVGSSEDDDDDSSGDDSDSV